MISIPAKVITYLAAASALSGCKTPAPQVSRADSALAANLAGTWNMQFRLIRSPVLTLDTVTAPREIRGKLSLLVNRSLDRSFRRIGIPTNYGSYDVDLTPFGFDTRVGGNTPTAVAGRLSGDSIEVILSPESEIGELVLIGRLEGNNVVGTWRVTLPRSAGEGIVVAERIATPGQKF
jgi:hypothetical protein